MTDRVSPPRPETYLTQQPFALLAGLAGLDGDRVDLVDEVVHLRARVVQLNLRLPRAGLGVRQRQPPPLVATVGRVTAQLLLECVFPGPGRRQVLLRLDLARGEYPQVLLQAVALGTRGRFPRLCNTQTRKNQSRGGRGGV